MNKKRKITQVSWLGHKTIVFTSLRKLAIIFILFFTLFRINQSSIRQSDQQILYRQNKQFGSGSGRSHEHTNFNIYRFSN